MGRFGITALNEFRNSLKNYKEFCQHLCKLNLFQDANFEMAQKILTIPIEKQMIPVGSNLVDFKVILEYVRDGQFGKLPKNHESYQSELDENMDSGENIENVEKMNGL